MSVCFYSKSAVAKVGQGSMETAPAAVTPTMHTLQDREPRFRQLLSNFSANPCGGILITLPVGDFCRHVVGGGSLIGATRQAYDDLLTGLVSEMGNHCALVGDGSTMPLCFLTVEHAFHCAKLTCVGQFEKALCFEFHMCAPGAVGKTLHGPDIKSAGGRRGLYKMVKEEMAAWDKAMPHVLRYLVVEKFTQNKRLQDMLCLTEGLELYHIANPRARAGSADRLQRWTWLEAHRDSILQARRRDEVVKAAPEEGEDDALAA
jgi:hypothetical protein